MHTRCAAIVVIAVVVSPPLRGGINTWTNRGPVGGTVTAIAFSPRNPAVVLAGALGGVFRSTDGGVSWNGVLPGGENFAIRSIAFCAKNNDVFVATTEGLFRSDDAGATWYSPDLLEGARPSVVVAAADSSAFYAATKEGLYISNDTGRTWTPRAVAGKTEEVIDVDVSSVRPFSVYVATAAGLHMSSDSGTTWKSFDTPADIRGVVLQTPSTLHVWTKTSYHRSTDGGRNWSAPKPPDETAAVRWMVVAPPHALYARAGDVIWQSRDGGDTWSKFITMTEAAVVTIAANPSKPSEVFVGYATDGISLTTDNGESWTGRNDGFMAATVTSMAMDPTGSRTIYATAGGLYRSTDFGRTWTLHRRSAGLPYKDVAVGGDGAIYLSDGLSFQRSSDGGTLWEKTGASAIYIAADPRAKRTLYKVSGISGVERSDDRGASWRSVSEQVPFGRIAVSPDGAVYVRSRSSLSYSADGGKSWETIDPGIREKPEISALAIAPKNPNQIYLATAKGVVRSTTGAKGPWKLLTNGLPRARVTAIAIHPTRPESLVVTTDGQGVFASNNSGDQWLRFRDSSPSYGSAVLIDADAMGTHVYVGTAGQSIWEIEIPK